MLLFQRSKNPTKLLNWLVASCVMVNAPISLASQSTIEQLSTYNSEKQFAALFSGTWGFSEKAFSNFSFTHARAPTAAIGEDELFYHGSAGLGYAVDNLAFTGGFSLSQSSLEKINSRGGYLGLTYIFIPENSETGSNSDQALQLLHSQIFEKNEEAPALFWTRLAYSFNSMKGHRAEQEETSERQSTFTFEAYYPIQNDILLSAVVGFHSFEDPTGLFSRFIRNRTILEQHLQGLTIQEAVRTTLSFQVFWQIAPRDVVLPRTQFSQAGSSQAWVNTIDFAWRHQFGRSWFLTPTYELSLQEQHPISGLILSLVYAF